VVWNVPICVQVAVWIARIGRLGAVGQCVCTRSNSCARNASRSCCLRRMPTVKSTNALLNGTMML
jgi:hypothetical protein